MCKLGVKLAAELVQLGFRVSGLIPLRREWTRLDGANLEYLLMAGQM